MSEILERIRQRRNELAPQGGALSNDDFESPVRNSVISEGKSVIDDIVNAKPADRQAQQSISESIAARRAQLKGGGEGNDKRIIATTDDGGRILEDAQGNRSFTSPNYATIDPDRIAQIMEGATPAEASRSGMNQDIINQNPVAARLTKFVEGTPFIGSYLDEGIGAIAGEDAAQAVRATSQAMDEENPNESLALGVAGGITGAVPMAAAALPSLGAAAPATATMRAVAATGLGATTGAVEGAVYGSGNQSGEGRAKNAIDGAAWGGALGGGFALGGSLGADGLKALLRRSKKVDVKVIAEEFGLSTKGAIAVKKALAAEDFGQARKVIAEMGDEAMLADAGQSTAAMLDAAAQTGGQALRTTREAVEGRLTRMTPKLKKTLDATLGKPKGTRAANKEIGQKSAATRKRAYDAAFAQPINYASDKGRKIEEVLERVPERTMNSAIEEANEQMVADGLKNQQIMASISEDGSVVFSEPPNSQQVHQIKVALQSIAEKETDDVTGKITQKGRRASMLSSQLRDSLNDANPMYRRATKLGGDTIAERNALELGGKLLRSTTTVETVEDFMQDAPDAVKNSMKQGIRNYVEQTTSNVRRAMTDTNMDAREAIQLVKDMSSSASREKLTAAIGQKAADQLLREVDQLGTALELRGMVSRNSATAPRQAMQSQVKDLAQPGAITSVGRGSPLEAGRKVVQALTGATDEAISDRQKAMFDEIATALTQVRGADAERALTLVESAMQGQPLKDAEAQFVARLIAQPISVTGDTTGREVLAR